MTDAQIHRASAAVRASLEILVTRYGFALTDHQLRERTANIVLSLIVIMDERDEEFASALRDIGDAAAKATAWASVGADLIDSVTQAIEAAEARFGGSEPATTLARSAGGGS